MHNRMTSRKRPDGGGGATRPGQTVPAQGETQDPVPRMPHERDESADSQGSREASGTRIGQQALDDLQRGRVDTDKGPAMDAAYAKVSDDKSARKPRQ